MEKINLSSSILKLLLNFTMHRGYPPPPPLLQYAILSVFFGMYFHQIPIIFFAGERILGLGSDVFSMCREIEESLESEYM